MGDRHATRSSAAHAPTRCNRRSQAEGRGLDRRPRPYGPDAARHAIETLRTLATEQETLTALLQRIGAAMPQWRPESDLPLSAAVQLFWPR
jgi:hypothetical protein